MKRAARVVFVPGAGSEAWFRGWSDRFRGVQRIRWEARRSPTGGETSCSSLGCAQRFAVGRGFALALAAVVGCGGVETEIPARHPVQGRVVLAGGKPLGAGRITFIPRDVRLLPASGAVGPDGGFRLTTRDDGDGAAAGEYKVRIEPAASAGDRRGGRRLSFPVKYVDEDSSGLLVTVRAGSNDLKPIVLK